MEVDGWGPGQHGMLTYWSMSSYETPMPPPGWVTSSSGFCDWAYNPQRPSSIDYGCYDVYWPFDPSSIHEGDYVQVMGTAWRDIAHGTGCASGDATCQAKSFWVNVGQNWAREIHGVNWIQPLRDRPTEIHSVFAYSMGGDGNFTPSLADSAAPAGFVPTHAEPGYIDVQSSLRSTNTTPLTVIPLSYSPSTLNISAGATNSNISTAMYVADVAWRRCGECGQPTCIYPGVSQCPWSGRPNNGMCLGQLPSPCGTGGCGTVADACGGAPVDCGSCSAGQVCSNGICCPSGQVSDGTSCSFDCSQCAECCSGSACTSYPTCTTSLRSACSHQGLICACDCSGCGCQ